MFREMSRKDKIELSIIWGLAVLVFIVLEMYYRTFGAGNIWDLVIY